MTTKQRQSQAARRRGGPSRGSGLAWFLSGTITGSLATWGWIGWGPAAEQVRSMVGRTIGQSGGADSAAPKPKFEFYTLLPEMEVVVPEEELAAPPPAAKDVPAKKDAPAAQGASKTQDSEQGEPDPASAPGTAREAGGHYIVQVASFRNVRDADGLKARLTLMGFEPVVQGVVISGDEKRYRVRLGPYPDLGSLEAARLQLRESGYDEPLVVRVSRG